MVQPVEPSSKRHAPAALRNRGPIADVLKDVLPASGHALEIASGSGEHVIHFAAAFPGISWQPSDPDAQACASIQAWSAEAGLPNLLPPLQLDVRSLPWAGVQDRTFDAVLAINMIHIAPWACCSALMQGARTALRPEGFLLLYGPFKIGGAHTAPSNDAFDVQLRLMDPAYGVRDLEDVLAEAAGQGFTEERRVAMPANNFSIILRRR